ncbi:hypothetical protein HHK36_010749 [Tetracentron sinense]|uniref:MENTAL domain-containing protein n=1 Tax=Tetracentron sinense TaxID=13715 RepID=A0A834ZB26_TETSI|nr:hypothetical protein HHK36_010749 [Tetracentron sinense]
MVAAVKESRMSRRGTVVQIFKALDGSSEVAIVAAAAPPPSAVATTASFALARHRDRVAIFTQSGGHTDSERNYADRNREMGLSKDEKSRRVLRGIKTLFFLITMLFSLLLFSAPILVVIADMLLPSALLSASLYPSSLSLQTISSNLRNYDFRYSLVDIPLISIVRSAVIICVYSFCDGPRLSRGPYLGITTLCSLLSLVFVSLKASYVFGVSSIHGDGYIRAMEVALFICSLVLAVGHIVVAYRISCRERRKMLIYKIDIEAISACKKGFPIYQKLLQEERVK